MNGLAEALALVALGWVLSMVTIAWICVAEERREERARRARAARYRREHPSRSTWEEGA